jgi:transcriptional regulator with XRE-family HTH domain
MVMTNTATNTGTGVPTPADRVLTMTGAERRKAREAIGKTQIQVAVECGVALGTVRNWEIGITPQPHRAAAYARALGLDGGAL